MAADEDKAFNAFINHLMANKGTCCHATSGRYCEEGIKLKQAYSLEVKGYENVKKNRKR